MKSLENNELLLAAAQQQQQQQWWVIMKVENLCQVVTNGNGHW